MNKVTMSGTRTTEELKHPCSPARSTNSWIPLFIAALMPCAASVLAWLVHVPAVSSMTISLFLFPLFCGLGVLGASFLVFLSGVTGYIVHTLIHPQRRAASCPDPERVLQVAVEHVSFPSAKGEHLVQGFYLPAPFGRTTILVSPGYRRGVKDILEVCRELWDAGHQVLAFDYYGHGTQVGSPVTLGYQEVSDFLGAVAYAKQRAPHTRIGAFGYSMGAAVSLVGAAQTHEVEAVVADSAFATCWSAVERAVCRTLHVKQLPRWFSQPLYALTDGLLWLRAGHHFRDVEPVREIAKLAPRPILLLHGTNDIVVSPDDARRLYEAAQGPKRLWLIEGAEHVKGSLVDRPAYVRRVQDFFAQAFAGLLAGEDLPEKHTDALHVPIRSVFSSF